MYNEGVSVLISRQSCLNCNDTQFYSIISRWRTREQRSLKLLLT